MQSLTQQFSKKMVIAVPMPLVVQGDDEQVGLFEIFQGFLPGSIGVAQNGSSYETDGITKGAAQAVEDGRAQQKSLNAFGLPVKDWMKLVAS